MRVSTATGAGTNPSSEYVTSAEALMILAVKPQTLYSYVSRGLIRRISPEGRTCFYNREDIRRLKARSTARSGHGAVAGGAMQWGDPILVTGVTEITRDGPRYRRQLASDLARGGYTLEAIAEYLWTGEETPPEVTWSFDSAIMRIAPQLAEIVDLYPNIHLRQLLTEIVLLLCVEHNQSRRPPQQAPSLTLARALVQALCGAFGFVGHQRRYVAPEANESVAHYILRAFGLDPTAHQSHVLNAAMVLLADHEFTPATFAARIAASAGVDLHSCVGAALQVQFGSVLGLRCDRVEEALHERHSGGPAPTGMVPLPAGTPLGFNHPLYTDGDPRAGEILELALSLEEHAAASRAALQTLRRIDDHHGTISLDAALVMLCRALGLNGPVASGLLAVSRSVGWIAHIMEQYQQEFMIRRRGKFAEADASADRTAA